MDTERSVIERTFEIVYWKFNLTTNKAIQIKDVFDMANVKDNEILCASMLRPNSDSDITKILVTIDHQLKLELSHLNLTKVIKKQKTVLMGDFIIDPFKRTIVEPCQKYHKVVVCFLMSPSISILNQLNDKPLDFQSIAKIITFYSRYVFQCRTKIELSNILEYEYQ